MNFSSRSSHTNDFSYSSLIKYKQSKYKGLIIAFGIVTSWIIVITLGVTNSQPFATNPLSDFVWILLSTWLYTGVFITAHEAMHNLIVPKSLQINKLIGQVVLTLYAGLSFNKLLRGHIDHHSYPSTTSDPDFWPYKKYSFFRWYFRFLYEYFSISSLIFMATLYNICAHILRIEESQLIFMWILPQILSSLQLFYFGTYLPHRPDIPYEGQGLTKTRSNHYSYWVSFLTCFHFGYHYEHHAYPYVPWWDLHKVKQKKFPL